MASAEPIGSAVQQATSRKTLPSFAQITIPTSTLSPSQVLLEPPVPIDLLNSLQLNQQGTCFE
jgi:hypothetical protein